MTIREMKVEDWNSVFQIYKQGVDDGKSTFNTKYPSWDDFNAGHKDYCRFVALINGEIVGFVAVSPVSEKHHYSGVVEVMVYIDEHYRNKGIGTALLNKLIEEAPNYGIWCLYSSIFSANKGSIRLHIKCGFRMIGYRERIARDKHGEWTDTVMMEYRFPDEMVKSEN